MDVLLVIDMQQGLFDNPRHQDAQVIANINRLADRVPGRDRTLLMKFEQADRL